MKGIETNPAERHEHALGRMPVIHKWRFLSPFPIDHHARQILIKYQLSHVAISAFTYRRYPWRAAPLPRLKAMEFVAE